MGGCLPEHHFHHSGRIKFGPGMPEVKCSPAEFSGVWVKWLRSGRRGPGIAAREHGQDLAEGFPPNDDWWTFLVFFAISEKLKFSLPESDLFGQSRPSTGHGRKWTQVV